MPIMSRKKKILRIAAVCLNVFVIFKIVSMGFLPTEQHEDLQNKKLSEKEFWTNYYQGLINGTKLMPSQPYNLTEHNCNVNFYNNMEDNMRTVLNYPVITRMENMYNNISKTFIEPTVITNGSDDYPVIVTGSSSAYYSRSLAMIKSVKERLLPLYKGMKFVFFDLGLNKKQLSTVTKYCNCEVRSFPFHEFPPFVSQLKNYVWKPIIIHTMLREYNFVMWADASFNFNGDKNATDNFFQKAKETGILATRLDGDLRSYYDTKEETFKYLKETPCLFYLHQMEASFLTILKTPFTWKYIIQPWVACALTENCMSHPNPGAVLHCRRKKDAYHWCHRFDQSVLSIILQRLFNTDLDIVSLNRLPSIGRVDRMQWLSSSSFST